MPTDPYQWFFFLLYTIGSVGGIVYIAQRLTDLILKISHRKPEGDRAYDPWAVDIPLPAPVSNPVANIEPPLTTRTK